MENQDIFKSVPYIYNASSFEYKLTNVFKKNTDCQLEANIIVKLFSYDNLVINITTYITPLNLPEISCECIAQKCEAEYRVNLMYKEDSIYSKSIAIELVYQQFSRLIQLYDSRIILPSLFALYHKAQKKEDNDLFLHYGIYLNIPSQFLLKDE